MNDTSSLLASLADVQEPLPPEQGLPWLLVVNVLLLLALGLVVVWRWHRHRYRWRREALHTLHQARRGSAKEQLMTTARVLRQLGRHRLGASVNRLHGDAWLQALDDCFQTHWFTRGEGQVFGQSLYTAVSLPDKEMQTRLDTVKRLIQKLPARSKTTPGVGTRSAGLRQP